MTIKRPLPVSGGPKEMRKMSIFSKLFKKKDKSVKEVPAAAAGDSGDEEGYASVMKHEDCISVCFYIEADVPFAIGEKMNAIREDAYMNGHNWGAFFNYYLPKYAPGVADGMEEDSEAGLYTVCYDLTPENEKKAERFAKIINDLVENENELYRIIREEGDKIEWV